MSFLRNALRLSRLSWLLRWFLTPSLFCTPHTEYIFQVFLAAFFLMWISESSFGRISYLLRNSFGSTVMLGSCFIYFVVYSTHQKNSFSARYFLARARVNLLCTSNLLSLHTEQQNFKERRKTFCFRLNYPTPFLDLELLRVVTRRRGL